MAQEMLRRGNLSGGARRLLQREGGPFLLGHTAPDVKTISGQKRETCHFYAIPRTSSRASYRVLFDAHPELLDVDQLSSSQAAFIAGYIAHLLLDELWLEDVFRHSFLQDWGPLRERLFVHNVLRTWIDTRDQERLDSTVTQLLRETNPDGWLPFVADRHLRLWRDWLVEQLASDHAMETAEVFAHRMGIPAEEVESIVRSPKQMENRVFRHFPRSALQSFQEKGHRHSALLTNWYIGRLARGQPEQPRARGAVTGRATYESERR